MSKKKALTKSDTGNVDRNVPCEKVMYDFFKARHGSQLINDHEYQRLLVRAGGKARRSPTSKFCLCYDLALGVYQYLYAETPHRLLPSVYLNPANDELEDQDSDGDYFSKPSVEDVVEKVVGMVRE